MTVQTPSSSPNGRFKSPAAFRAWLEKHHATKTELAVHCYKVAHAHKGMTYLQAVDEALCFGWIDGITRRFDDETYLVRFTPRKARSNWSLVNIKKVEVLIAAGRMAPAGLAAYNARRAARTGVYSFEQPKPAVLAPELEAAFTRRRDAWEWFQSRPPGYRRTTMYWVMSAKQEGTRQRRLEQLIDCSARRTIIPALMKRP